MKRKLDWDAVVTSFEGCGLTHAEFCKQRKVSLASFRKHLYKNRSEQVVAPAFAELSIASAIEHQIPVEFHLADGSFLRFPEGVEAADLLHYVTFLRS